MPSAAARMRLCRQRQRAGLVRIPVLVDEAGLEVLLVRHGLLPCCGTEDESTLRQGLEQLLERLIAADAQQHNG